MNNEQCMVGNKFCPFNVCCQHGQVLRVCKQLLASCQRPTTSTTSPQQAGYGISTVTSPLMYHHGPHHAFHLQEGYLQTIPYPSGIQWPPHSLQYTLQLTSLAIHTHSAADVRANGTLLTKKPTNGTAEYLPAPLLSRTTNQGPEKGKIRVQMSTLGTDSSHSRATGITVPIVCTNAVQDHVASIRTKPVHCAAVWQHGNQSHPSSHTME